ncbi:MAG: hypothetical protein WBW48_10485 [Anaerolineae bacterium]
MELMVECYSGHTYAQEPRAFAWHGERHVVQAVERAWRAPKGPHFLVRTEGGSFFELAYDETEDVWSVRECLTTATSRAKNSNQTTFKEDQR